MNGPEFVAVGLIVWAVFIITFIVMRGLGWKHREKQIAARHAEREHVLLEHAGASREQVQVLEDRLRVLERIVTDRGYNLASDIEALRDRNPAREVEGSN